MEKDSFKALTASSPSRRMWEYFSAISEIPRPSGHEEGVRQYLTDCAASLGWEIRRDRIGNIVFSVPGRGALAGSETLILQGHMDMVCEKDRDVVHDFLRDPLHLRIDGDWLRADGTTLGADNGIAIT